MILKMLSLAGDERSDEQGQRSDNLQGVQLMPRISIQLHATVDDLVGLLLAMRDGERGDLLGFARHEVQAKIEWQELSSSTVAQYERVIALPRGATASIGDDLEALIERCAFLSFSVPEVDGDRLKDTLVGVLDPHGNYPEQLAMWRKLLNRFKKPLIRGATFRNPLAGESQFYPSLLATPAAVALSRNGVALMLGDVNTAEFITGDASRSEA
ncbi:hypothetical protein SOM22_14025 [Stenotrophomonas rhizophila]|uniref:hypothetical protein n=1 Tax=Stenotrophomonas rhizophila TaxID=216778 RepID=UPI002A69D096|nr:hypothetical protein [Stenotrophomonas rhizophila]MDY0955691.1 hypothetical protein [Stenotrophomonas rhizophila]